MERPSLDMIVDLQPREQMVIPNLSDPFNNGINGIDLWNLIDFIATIAPSVMQSYISIHHKDNKTVVHFCHPFGYPITERMKV